MPRSARFAGSPERASPRPRGTNRKTFSIALTPPTDPQTRQKIDPTSAGGSGDKVAKAIAAKLAIVRTNPALRRCGAGATVSFIDGGEVLGGNVCRASFLLVPQRD